MPGKELEGLQAVHRFLNVNNDIENELQEIVEIAAEICEMPVAILQLADADVSHFVISNTLAGNQDLQKSLFCRLPVNSNEMVIRPDLLTDAGLKNNPFVIQPPYLRFYAGVPIITHDGQHIGTFCVMDVKSRVLTVAQQHLIKMLAKRVLQVMEFEVSIKIVRDQFIAAKDSEVKLRSFFESSSACHLLISRNLEIIAYNKNMAGFIRKFYNIELQNGTLVSTILHGAILDRFIGDFNKAMSGEAVIFDREVTYPNGETIWWYVTFEPCLNQNGDIVGVSYIATDITERKLHEQQITRQNESLKNIAYIQSHGLRKPVASILGLVNIFRSEHYKATPEELRLLEQAALEMDRTIRAIVSQTDNN